MCAEAVWWRCHRGIITDYLIAADEAQSHRRRTLDYRSEARIGWIAELSDRRIRLRVVATKLLVCDKITFTFRLVSCQKGMADNRTSWVFCEAHKQMGFRSNAATRCTDVLWIFEVLPKKERFDEYLELAKYLKPTLQQMDGFVDNDRFASKRRPGSLLSHSIWRDEKSVIRWRTESKHHKVQERGRLEIFQDYHLRVGEITYDSDTPANVLREQRFDETEVGSAKMVTFTELTVDDGKSLEAQPELLPDHVGLELSRADVVEHDIFSSIYTPGKLALLVSWTSADSARKWTPQKAKGVKTLRNRRIRIIRDYGMFDRRESPQFFPNLKASEVSKPLQTDSAGIAH